MSLREQWNELDTGLKVLVGLGTAVVLLIVLLPILLIVAAVVASFLLGLGGSEAAAGTTVSMGVNTGLGAILMAGVPRSTNALFA